MSQFKALLVYEEILREFTKRLSSPTFGLAETLESGFGYLVKRLQFTQASVMWWDPERRCFDVEYGLEENTLMECEEEVPVSILSPLEVFVEEQQPMVISAHHPWMAYIPLVNEDGKLMGAVRFVRAHPLPKGNVLQRLSRITGEASTARQYPFLEDLSDILSERIQALLRHETHERKEHYLQAGAEVAAAVLKNPRVTDMLQEVSQSIISHLGFDRVRFYLLESQRSEICGIVGLQIPGRPLNLIDERYSLKANTNSLVDVMLKKDDSPMTMTAGGKVVYMPLQVGGETIGCMVVDNLLSQQNMEPDQLQTLQILSGQIAMATQNARMFEDIEQQAITDGMTKLYVWRYFQQRLKEEIDRADRYSYSLALVMMDVDHFKNLNDTHGHLVGDAVLEYLANHIRSNIRRIDLAARYGGDEFVLLLPEITEQEAWLMGARLINTLKSHVLKSPAGEAIPIHITMGVAMYPTDAHNTKTLIQLADQALYWGKKNNRGDVCFYKAIGPKSSS